MINVQEVKYDTIAAIAINKSRLAVDKSHKPYPAVYLQDKQEFQIELFNGQTRPVMAKIKINNLSQSRGIILAPGERVFLERFIDSDKKLMFHTYQVETDFEDLTRDNGIVQISFYPESNNSFWYLNSTPFIVAGGSYFSTDPNTYRTYTSDGSQTAMFRADSPAHCQPAVYSVNSHETGRVMQGEQSGQKFGVGCGDFQWYPDNTVTFQLLPLSQKHCSAKELRVYCTECGKKVKDSWKFCPICGHKS